MWKQTNRKEEQLENEIYLLKQTFCRVSKRLVLLENFITHKFPSEFPPPSFFQFVKVSNSTNSPTSIKKKTAKIIVSKCSKSKVIIVNSETVATATDEKNCPSPSPSTKDPSTTTEEVFLIDSEGQPIDWESSVTAARNETESSSKISNPNVPVDDVAENINTEDDELQEKMRHAGPSSVESEVVIEHQKSDPKEDNEEGNSNCSDNDYKPEEDDDASDNEDDPGYTVEVDKTDEQALNWLLGEQNSSDSEYEPNEKGKAKTKTKSAVSRPLSKKYNNSTKLTCTICQRVFFGSKASGNLKCHMDIHSAVRKYKCRICDKAFRQKRPLRTHMRRIHEKEKYAVHVCQFCGKKFVSPRERIHHEQTHTGEKPHTCEICGFSCIQANNLKRHMESHVGKRDILCPQCGKSFMSNERLRCHHKNVHQGEFGADGKRLKTVICEICSAAFVSTNSRRSHMNKVHQGIKPNNANPKPQQFLIIVKENEVKSEETTQAVLSIPSE